MAERKPATFADVWEDLFWADPSLSWAVKGYLRQRRQAANHETGMGSHESMPTVAERCGRKRSAMFEVADDAQGSGYLERVEHPKGETVARRAGLAPRPATRPPRHAARRGDDREAREPTPRNRGPRRTGPHRPTHHDSPVRL